MKTQSRLTSQPLLWSEQRWLPKVISTQQAKQQQMTVGWPSWEVKCSGQVNCDCSQGTHRPPWSCCDTNQPRRHLDHHRANCLVFPRAIKLWQASGCPPQWVTLTDPTLLSVSSAQGKWRKILRLGVAWLVSGSEYVCYSNTGDNMQAA